MLSLGTTPLANALPAAIAEFAHEPFYPLDLYLCTNCCLVQLLDVIDPAVLFRQYLYTTGTSTTMAAHNAALAAMLVQAASLTPGDLVVDVASNDGSLLREIRRHHVRTLGIEPAANLADMARRDGIETLNRFFDSVTAADVLRSHGPARVITATNVLAHVDDTLDFLTGCRMLLADDGVLVVEVPWLRELINRTEYDTIYHEHLCYFSVTSLMQLFAAADLSITRVDHVPIHGGSLRVFGSRGGGDPQSGNIAALVAEERRSGLCDLDTYRRFGDNVLRQKTQLVALLTRLKEDGQSVAGYGAPAKGSTLVNFCGLTPELVSVTADRNPLKVGRYMPGTHIPIVSVSELVETRPDYILVLSWNLADEVISQLKDAFSVPPGFILPIPTPRIVVP